MKAALTREEGREEEKDFTRGNVFIDGENDIGLIPAVSLFDAEERHALAALALHNQEFGFTREMVSAIRECESEVPNGKGDVYVCLWMPQEQMDTMMAAADCISSLLPPEDLE